MSTTLFVSFIANPCIWCVPVLGNSKKVIATYQCRKIVEFETAYINFPNRVAPLISIQIGRRGLSKHQHMIYMKEILFWHKLWISFNLFYFMNETWSWALNDKNIIMNHTSLGKKRIDNFLHCSIFTWRNNSFKCTKCINFMIVLIWKKEQCKRIFIVTINRFSERFSGSIVYSLTVKFDIANNILFHHNIILLPVRYYIISFTSITEKHFLFPLKGTPKKIYHTCSSISVIRNILWIFFTLLKLFLNVLTSQMGFNVVKKCTGILNIRVIISKLWA